MKTWKYIGVFVLLLLIYKSKAQTHCHAVQLKLYPTNFLANTDGPNRRDKSNVYKIEYTVYKKGGGGDPDTILFNTGERKCYIKKNAIDNAVTPLILMNTKEAPFFVTLCFENTGEIDLSNYYLKVESNAYGYHQVRKKKNKKARCNGGGSETNASFTLFDENLSDLNTAFRKTIPHFATDDGDIFVYMTEVERKDIPYPLFSMPEEIAVCKNELPFILDIEKYTYDLKLQYFSDHSTTIKKQDGASWNNVYTNSSNTTFAFNNLTDAGTYAVRTVLNLDCEMNDTFNLVFIDTPAISIPVVPTICQNGIGTIFITPDTVHRSYLWKDVFDNCLSRYPSLTVEDTGVYTAYVTGSNGCYSRKAVQVDYTNGDVVKFASPDIVSCFDLPNTLELEPVSDDFTVFKWSTGEDESAIMISRPGLYKLEVEDANGCKSTASVNVIDSCVTPVHTDIQTHSYIARIEKRNFDDLDSNAVSITDPRSGSSTIEYGEGDIVKKKAFVRLQYHRSEMSDYRDSIWTLYVPYEINIDNNVVEQRTLLIKKTNALKDVYETVFEHIGGDEQSVQINADDILILDRNGNTLALADIPDDINLELELQVEVVPASTAASTEINSTNLVSAVDDGNKKITIQWDGIKEAIDYELQFAFIDALDQNTTIDENLFNTKGWSIMVPDNTYTLDATFPKGKLEYRVRPVGRKTEFINSNYNHIKYGQWSDVKEIPINTGGSLTPFEPEKNWKKVITFAEDGKKKEVISYMDGAFRTNQVLTNLNTEKLTLAAETYYDYESRPTLNVLPVPLEDNNLKYKTDLATVATYPMGKGFVDGANQQPLDNTSGAAAYYSEYNSFADNPDFTNKVNMNSIPQSDGYVTTKVEYSRDNTGRVVKQSGVGAEFYLDSDENSHFTRFFYATPAQTELNRLFGSNVGKAVFYNKQMTVDPNGQVSITYTDNKEKIIATALAGDSPANLADIEKPEPEVMDVNMTENNIRDSLAKTSISTNIILNDVPNKEYSFVYSIHGGSDSGSATEYCKDCKYRLEIGILNPKGTPLQLELPEGVDLPDYASFTTYPGTNSSNSYIVGNLSKGFCEHPDSVYDDIQFEASFASLGNYTFIKKITLLEDDEASIQDYLDQIEFPSLDSFIAQNISGYIDTLICRNDCQSRTQVYLRDVRRQDSLNENLHDAQYYIEIADSIVAAGWCDPFLETQLQSPDYAVRYCDQLLKSIMRQISPGEKYFDNSTYPAIVSVLKHPHKPINEGKKDSLVAWGLVRDVAATHTFNLKDSIIYRWNDDIAEKVAKLFGDRIHKEYCHYENCMGDTAYAAFDIRLGLTDFPEAIAKGYITASGSYEANNRSYAYGPLMQEQLDDPVIGAELTYQLEHYVSVEDFPGSYLLIGPVNTMGNRITHIDAINAVMPRKVYYADSAGIVLPSYSTAITFYRDSLSYDINTNYTLQTAEWDSAFWTYFSAAFLSAKKKALAKLHEPTCPYLQEEDALVKDPNIGILQSYIQVNSLFDNNPYCEACYSKAEIVADKLARECRAIREYFASDTTFRRSVVDSLANYCKRVCNKNENFLGAITATDILNGKLDAIIGHIETIEGADSCDIGDILAEGMDIYYDSDTNVHYICEENPCSIQNVFNLANHYRFNYPVTDTLIFREGFDSGPATVFYADSIYKDSVQMDGYIINKLEPMKAPGNVDLVGYNNMRNYYDALGDSLGYYLYNFTLSGNHFDKIFWENTEPIPVESGKKYLLSYYLTNISFDNISIYPVIESDDSTYSDSLKVMIDTVSCGFGWNKYQYIWTAPLEVDSIFIKVFNDEPYGYGNDFLFDEIRLEEIRDTVQAHLDCPNFKDMKFYITPSEITMNYAACENASAGGGMSSLIFLDSAGNRIQNIQLLAGKDTTSYVPPLDKGVFIFRHLEPLHLMLMAQLTTGIYVDVFPVLASCTLIDYAFDNDNNPIDNLPEYLADENFLNSMQSYLNDSSNYICSRDFDTCSLKPYHNSANTTIINWDSLQSGYVPDTFYQSCIDRQVNAQKGWLTQLYNDSLSKILTEYQLKHIANCFKNLNEDFYYSAILNEYHYTLYYYDQSGNLVQTIPPAGVYPLPSSGFDSHGRWLGGAENEPKHVLKTIYQFNTRNQLIAQHTPDGGMVNYWYNQKGMLILSQNEKQKDNDRFSFTRYDALGRPVLVGELVTPDMFQFDPTATVSAGGPDYRDTINKVILDPMFPLNYVGETGFDLVSLVQTEYDQPSILPGINQDNLHNRVSAVYTYEDYEAMLAADGIATIYSYDEVGNVKTLVQDMSHSTQLTELPQNADADQLKKRVDYDYDLVSGKVNAVVFNNGSKDQFKHRYEYDADNRITDVYSSTDNTIEYREAKYFYFPHGPLGRIELGHNQIQSIDYAYTLQGWLKSINGSMYNNTLNGKFGQPLVASVLGYYKNDYTGIAQTDPTDYEFEGFADFYNAQENNKYKGLYNGNIIYTVNDLRALKLDTFVYGGPGEYSLAPANNKTFLGMQYRYDQLNRIIASEGKTPNINHLSYNSLFANGFYYNGSDDVELGYVGNLYNSYKTRYKYDANGNIVFLERHAPDFVAQKINLMDSLVYLYAKDNSVSSDNYGKLYNNRLYHVNDFQEDDERYGLDLDDQGEAEVPESMATTNITQYNAGMNYRYDKTGQLIYDAKEGIASISWTPYGKIDEILRNGNQSNLKFVYDALGNRVAKIETFKEDEEVISPPAVTFYFRDAQGNPLDIVQPKVDGEMYSEEHEYNIYGSSRIGTLSKSYNFDNTNTVTPFERDLGDRQYELTNHLGNVLTTFTDQKYLDTLPGNIPLYRPVASTVTDYYPFGMPMPGRTLPYTYDHHEVCTGQDSSEYAALIDEEYDTDDNPNNWNWKPAFNLADILQTDTGMVISSNYDVNEIPVFGIYRMFEVRAGRRYKITYTISDINDIRIDREPEVIKKAQVGTADLCYLDAMEKILSDQPLTTGTHTIEFMGTGDLVGWLGLQASDSIMFTLTAFKLEAKIFTPQCSTDVAYAKYYDDEGTDVNDWEVVEDEGFNSDASLEKDAGTFHFETSSLSGDNSINTITGMAYTSIATLPGYDYVLTFNGVDIERSNVEPLPIGFDVDTPFQYMCLIADAPENLAIQSYLGVTTLGTCCDVAEVRFTAQGTTTYIAFLNEFTKTDIYNPASTSLRIDSITMRGYEGTTVTRNTALTGKYRFGFNGMEKDHEIYGQGNSYTAEFWNYDPRLGRRWNIDPKPLIGLSVYSSFYDNPLLYSDPDGDEPPGIKTIPQFNPSRMVPTAEMVGRKIVEKAPLWQRVLSGISSGPGLFIQLMLVPQKGNNPEYNLFQKYKPAPTIAPEPNPQFDPKTKPGPTEAGEEGYYVYETGSTDKIRMGLVDKSAGDIAYFGITKDAVIGGRYSGVNERGSNLKFYHGIIAKTNYYLAGGIESALIILNTNGANSFNDNILSRIARSSPLLSTRIDNKIITFTDPKRIMSGVLWLNATIPDWQTRFLHKEEQKGPNHPNRASPNSN